MPTRDVPVLLVIAAGGAVGSLARYAAGRAWPDAGHAIPWTTLSINLLGSLLLGMLVVAVTEVWQPHRLTRPLLGTGVLGGFTTFSTFALDAQHLLNAGRPFLALGYAAASLVGCLAATAFAVALTRRTLTLGTAAA